MRKNIIRFLMGVWCLPLSLSSCATTPISLLQTFTRYKTEDGVLILDCEASIISGYGKVKLGDEYENIRWSKDRNEYLLALQFDDGDYVTFHLDFVNEGETYAKDRISIGNGETSDEDDRLFPLLNWSSTLSKERSLTEEEIDARYFVDVYFTNKKLGLKLASKDTIGEFSDGTYVSILNEDKNFFLKRKGYSAVSTGNYSNTKEHLYLTFEKDPLFSLTGKRIAFEVTKK